MGKKCGNCKEVKDLVEFNKDINKKDKLSTTCKECKREYYERYQKELKNGTRTVKKKIKPRDGHKICSRCDNEKSLKEFYNNRSTKDGLDNKCKDCSRESCKEYREKYKKEKRGDIKCDYKKCTGCEENKPARAFNKDKTKKYGLSSRCIDCRDKYHNDPEVKKRRSEYRKEYRSRPETKKLEREYDKKHNSRDDIKEKKKLHKREYRRMPDTIKRIEAYYQRPEVIEHKKNFRKEYNSRQDVIERRRAYQKEYRKTPSQRKYKSEYNKKARLIPSNRLNANISNAIRASLHGNKAGRHWEDLVGYTLDELRNHLEKQFTDGMNWDNYGKNGWEIDHITPQSFFDFTKPEHLNFKRCWMLSNLQPLWGIDNNRKNNKMDGEFQLGFKF